MNIYITPQKKKDLLKRLVEYINTHDFFWTTDMRISLNIVYSNVSLNPSRGIVDRATKHLITNGLLAVSDHRGTERQLYLTSRKIVTHDVETPDL